jgi:hypothetical protein
MELRYVGPGRKLDSDNRGYCGFSVILRKPLANFCRSHADNSVARSVIIGGPTKHFYSDHALTQGIQLTCQRVFHD